MDSEVKVSVYCLAYNHEKYIRDCLEGFVNQKTNFRFRVIVHDDASTDGTQEIIKEYASKYKDIIVPILQKENQYSQGINMVEVFIKPLLIGKYVAVCEGDDYWCDENKLQKQYDIMEAHPEYSASVHQTRAINCQTKEEGLCSKIKETGVVDINKIFSDRGPVYQTSSLFYRRELMDNKPPFCNISKRVGDYPLEMHLALQGKIHFDNEVMSVYRQFTETSWSLKTRDSKELFIEHCIQMAKILEGVDQYANYKYHDVLSKNIADFKYQIWKISPSLNACKDSSFKDLSISKKIKVVCRSLINILKRD